MTIAAIDESAPDPWLVEWARSLDVVADAWRPELESLIDRLELVPGSTVVDAGCGSGRITGWLADRVGMDGLVCAVDREPDVLEYAAAVLSATARGRVEAWIGDVTALPFPEDAFDAAWCSRVLAYVADPTAGLRELVRVVRPGGRIVVLDSDASRATFLPIEPELETRLRSAEHRALRAGVWGEPLDMHVGRRLYALARSLPVSRVEPISIVRELVAPLREVDRQYLAANLAWFTDPAARRWLRRDSVECRRLFHPASDTCVLDNPDLHVLQTATAVIVTV
jgi:SAM-dependent methyltransferase